MKTRSKTASVLVLAAIILSIAASEFFYATKPPPLPDPNGYDAFVRAGKMIGGSIKRITTLSETELSAFVRTNEAALKLGSSGLACDCRVPPYARSKDTLYRTNCEEVRFLVWGMAAQARLARLQNRTNDSVESSLECIAIGEKSYHGGMIICRMIGMDCEKLGFEELCSWTNLDSTQCRKICQKLAQLDVEDDSPEETLEESGKYHNSNVFLMQIIEDIGYWEFKRNPGNLFPKAFKENQQFRRQLTVYFAARAYELENGRRPASLAEMIPIHLKTIPQDPFTETNLNYAP